jgi:hypothetical protein
MPDSLVIELQRLARSGSAGLTEVLRHAKVVATKLSLMDAKAWLAHEMAGYSSGVDVPVYRRVSCELKGRNRFVPWETVRWNRANEIEEALSRWTVRQSVAEIEALIQSNGFIVVHLSQAEIDTLIDYGNAALANFQLARFLSRAGLAAILASVRDRVLDWSLELE